MKLSVIIFLLMCVCLVAGAQNISKVGVSKISLRNTGEVIQSGVIKGYYTFYNLEKIDRKNVNYLLTVLDENLQEVNSVEIVRSKNYVLIESVYNGNAFLFYFYDVKQKKTELISYDLTLKQTGQWIEPLNNVMLNAAYQQMARGSEPTQQYIVPVKDEGFVQYTYRSGNNNIYSIKYFDNSLKRVWTTEGTPGKGVVTASEGFQTDQYIGAIITEQVRTNVASSVLILDRKTGRQVIKTALATPTYTLSPSDVTYDSLKNEVIVFGEYYDPKDNELSDKSKGFGSFVITADGKIANEKLLSWADLSKMAPVDDKGKMDGSNTLVYFHDFVRTADGQIYGIGEQYKKVANGGAIAVKILIGNTGVANVQINVYDMVIFQFGPDYEIKKVFYFDKSKTRVPLPSGAGYYGAKRISSYVRAVGGFDFSFVQQPEDKQTFSVTYIDSDRSEGGKKVVGTITLTPEQKFVKDKLVITNKPTWFKVMRAKHGYFMIMEYYKSQKKFDMRLEKVNY